MGVTDAVRMNRKGASDRIDTLMDVPSQDSWGLLYERQGQWITDRFILYPDLYESEFQRYLDEQLPDLLHSYVRGRVTGASEKLTKIKIKKVIQVLTADDRNWWRSPQRNEIFFERLTVLFPACCEGGPRIRVPREGPKIEQQRFSLLDHGSLDSLFRHYVEFCEPWEICFSDGKVVASPHDLLGSLDNPWLASPINEYRADGKTNSYTVKRKKLFATESRTFTAIWHTDRHGWADSGPGSRSVHYYVPRGWIVNPPHTAEEMLISLCKKSWISNGSPFYPVDPQRTFCQTCTSHHENWNGQ